MKLEIRKTKRNDFVSLKQMIAEFQSFSRPASRSISDAAFHANIHTALDQLERILQFDSSFFCLSLWDAEKKEPAGYCIVELRDRNPILLLPQAYLLDIGVGEKYRGKFYWLALIKEACKNARQEYQWMGAAITNTNIRSLKTALRFGGFKIIGHQWMNFSNKPCSCPDSDERNNTGVSSSAPLEPSYTITENIGEVSSYIERNYLFRFPDWMNYSQNEILKWRKWWMEVLNNLLYAHGAGIVTAVMENKFCYAVLALNQYEATTGEKQGTVLDISLDQSVWETNLIHFLLKKMEKICHDSGHDYLVVNLPPGYEAYMEKWGYQKERFHIMRKTEDI